MNGIGKVLKRCREQSGLSLEELGKITGIPRSTLNRYENDTNQKIDMTKLMTIARALNVPPEVISEMWIGQYEVPKSDMRLLPILGRVCAGMGKIADEDVIGYEPANGRYIDGDYFYLQVTGDSMSPKIGDGSLVLVKRQDYADNSDVVVVIVDSEEGMIKQIEYSDTEITLVSFNPFYPPRVFKENDMNRVKIIGKVVQSTKKW